MPYGSPWSEHFVRQLSDRNVRGEFAADQTRARIAQLIRCLREQPDRNWTQAELGVRAGKPQNVISRFEDPDYGKMSLQSLFDLAAAFDLPVWIDMPEWEEWLSLIKDVPNQETRRASFDLEKLVEQARRASASEQNASPIFGGAAAAAASAIRNMLMSQAQSDEMRGAISNANASLSGSNKVPVGNVGGAIGYAAVARDVAA